MNNITWILAATFLLHFAVDPTLAWAAEETVPSGGYLAGYRDVDPMPTSSSWLSTLAYLFSLLVVFAVVLLLSYGAARFVGGRFSAFTSGKGGRLILSVALGPKMSVAVVEIAGQMLVLGVTEHNVSLLSEVTDPEEIDRLDRAALTNNMPTGVFSDQFSALSGVLDKLPPIFRKGGGA